MIKENFDFCISIRFFTVVRNESYSNKEDITYLFLSNFMTSIFFFKQRDPLYLDFSFPKLYYAKDEQKKAFQTEFIIVMKKRKI